jgi:hypothetical protein
MSDQRMILNALNRTEMDYIKHECDEKKMIAVVPYANMNSILFFNGTGTGYNGRPKHINNILDINIIVSEPPKGLPILIYVDKTIKDTNLLGSYYMDKVIVQLSLKDGCHKCSDYNFLELVDSFNLYKVYTGLFMYLYSVANNLVSIKIEVEELVDIHFMVDLGDVIFEKDYFMENVNLNIFHKDSLVAIKINNGDYKIVNYRKTLSIELPFDCRKSHIRHALNNEINYSLINDDIDTFITYMIKDYLGL